MANGGHTCARLSDQSTKCWGLNTWGMVGLVAGNGSPANKLLCSGDPKDCVGDTGGEMGDALTAAVPSGTTKRISVGYRHSCALLTNGQLKCWGSNEQGQIGLGDNTGNNLYIGDQANEMLPGNLVTTALKSGRVVEELTAGGFHTCVWNTDDTLNCWGFNSAGQLGRNDTVTWGDGPGEMGNSLLDVDTGP
jgi:alpha-tubulin suppressor-like RCC1 family protein